jgi:hypothetical protein
MGFLVDHDVAWAADSLFPGEVADGKLRDSEVVDEGWRNEATIVTANGPDFIREILRFQKSHSKGRTCTDMFGLIIIPNARYAAEVAIAEAGRRRGGLLGVGSPRDAIGLNAINEFNLCVSIQRGGTVLVRRFPVCPDRRRGEAKDGGFPGWFEALKVVGGAERR